VGMGFARNDYLDDKKMISQITLSKYTSTFLFITYLLLFPVWLYYATWYQLIIGYISYWFMIDVVQSLFCHRWASHNLWNPPKFVQNILATISVLALIGTPISWAAWHRTHHHYTDTENDPHSPKYKSWYYVVFCVRFQEVQLKRGIDRLRDSYFLFLSKYEIYFIVLGNLILFLLLPFVWFMTLWAIPVGFMIFNTNYFVNVVSHKNGEVKNISKLYWPLIFSDGIYHASHHSSPKLNYTKYDPAGYLITKLGWTNEKI